MFRSLCCAFILLSACATTPAAPDPVARIEVREGCGYITSCVSYEIAVRGDGAYTLRKPGGYEKKGSFGPEVWLKATKALDDVHFLTLPDQLPRTDGQNDPETGRGYPCMPDSPQAMITWRGAAGAESKLVQYNKGCDSTVGNKLLTDLHAAFGLADLLKE